MKVWHELYESHRKIALAEHEPKEITRRIQQLADRKIIPGTSVGKFSKSRNDRTQTTSWSLDGETGVQLSVGSLQEGRLGIQMTLDKYQRLRQFTITIQGTKSSDGAEWKMAVHFDVETQAGSGACGHPLLHCHASIESEPNWRVPLPPLRPEEALAWVMSQLSTEFEPAPWTSLAART
ncbi:MAG: hypothetical protein HY791_14460 [Deltaproteobacteria bacterium]|nr:hypothetical protein [Deltaproteobacteria bacterium]